MVEAAKTRVTVEEFLDWDDGTNRLYELVEGRPVAMAPTRPLHGVMVIGIGSLIRERLRPPCRVVAEAGITVDRDNLFIADLAVTCVPFRPDALIEAPRLIIEVLSPATHNFDLAKSNDYSAMPSVEEIWLIDSTRRWLRQWRRHGDAWIVTLPILSRSFTSDVLDGEVVLDRLYEGTGL